MLNRQPRSHECGRCPRTFTTSRALLRHLRETRCQPDDVFRIQRRYKCTKCSEAFSRDYDRRRHERRRHSDRNSNLLHQLAVQDVNEAESCRLQTGSSSQSRSGFTSIPFEPQILEQQSFRGIEVNDRKRTYGKLALEDDLHSNNFGIEKLSLEGEDLQKLRIKRNSIDHKPIQTHRRNPTDQKPILCTICRQPFNTNNPELLYSHLNDHFRGFNAVNWCHECGINFIEKAELDKHRISAATGHCGFKFHHTEPCTGHHPPGGDHIKLWDRISHWHQSQLQSFIERVNQLSTRSLGGRYVQTETSINCRGCRILDFLHRRFPDEYWAIYRRHLKEHPRFDDKDAPCCHPDMTNMATEQLLAKLTSRRRRRRASSADIEHVRRDASVTKREEPVQSPSITSEPDISGILDASYLENPLQGLLHWASCAGDRATIEAFLMNGADIHGTDISGRSALHWVAASGSVEAIELLLDHEGNIDAVDNAGQSPLFLAVECGNSDAVKVLLERGSDPNSEDSFPQSCIHIAANAGHAAIIAQLLSYGAHVDTTELFDRTALHLAVKSGHLDVVRTLCEAKASLELEEHAGRTALYIAIDTGKLDIARYLVDQGARVTDNILAKADAKCADEDLLRLLRSNTVFREDEAHDDRC